MLQKLSAFQPQKIIEILNSMVQRWQGFSISGSGDISVDRSGDRYSISLRSDRIGSREHYTGMFKAIIADDTILITDGMASLEQPGTSSEDSYAGFLYYNKDVFFAKSGTAPLRKGYLLIRCNSAGEISYVVEDRIPPCPVLSSGSTDDTGSFPIAQIVEDGAGFVIRQLCRYQIPTINVYGPCD